MYAEGLSVGKSEQCNKGTRVQKSPFTGLIFGFLEFSTQLWRAAPGALAI